MSTALAIRHLAFEDLGSFAPVLRRRGFTVAYRDAGLDDLAARDLLDADLLVVLGGPIGAYESRTYPFLTQEIRLIERRLAARRPVLGICLGAQLVAKALGARVYKGPRKELAWGGVTLTEAGEGTSMAWEANVKIAGPVGAMGQRVLQPIVNQQVGQVLAALEERVTEAAQGA